MATLIVSFLLLLAGLAAGQTCTGPDADVLILGGGMAGIVAAKTLHDNEVTNFVVLEAQGELGGRMRSAEIGGVRIELGANWIQQIDSRDRNSNPIWALSQRCVQGGLTGAFSDFDDLIAYSVQGQDITDELDSPFDEYGEALSTAETIIQNRTRDGLPDISVAAGLMMGGWTPQTAEQNWVEWFCFDFCFAESPSMSSLFRNIGVLSQIPDDYVENYFVTDQRGFASLVQCLANDFSTGSQDQRIHLNTTVTQIEWSDNCVCARAMENGENRRYCAPYAIVTFSIGVLQSEMRNRVFVPDLPSWKVDTIDQFSMTNYLKIFVEFNETFWDDVEYLGRVDERRGYYPVFQPLQQFLPNRPNLILATLVEEIANNVTRQPLEETKAQLVAALRDIYGNNASENILSIIVPDWDINPLFLGTYTNTPVGVTDETYRMLANPVGRLYFSGEATSRNGSGFLNGAYYSGIESANAVLAARMALSVGQMVKGSWILLTSLIVVLKFV